MPHFCRLLSAGQLAVHDDVETISRHFRLIG
jgi:hypothetical protein